MSVFKVISSIVGRLYAKVADLAERDVAVDPEPLFLCKLRSSERLADQRRFIVLFQTGLLKEELITVLANTQAVHDL